MPIAKRLLLRLELLEDGFRAADLELHRRFDIDARYHAIVDAGT